MHFGFVKCSGPETAGLHLSSCRKQRQLFWRKLWINSIMWKLMVLLSIGLCQVKGEVFTALVDLENVIYTEGNLLGALDEYIQQEEERLEKIKSKAEVLRHMNREAVSDTEHYLGHPVNAFLLVKRFLWEWVDLENWIKYDGPKTAYLRNSTQFKEHTPGQDDLKGATAALLRLQDTYKLQTKKLASGEIEGTKTTVSLTALECFELGRVAYNQDDQYHARLWITEAYRRYQNESKTGKVPDLDEPLLLDYLAFSSFKQGFLDDAITYTDRLLSLDPKHERAKNNKIFFMSELEEKEIKEKPRGEDAEIDDKTGEIVKTQEELEKEKAEQAYSYPERKQYEALCRGDPGALKVVDHRLLKCQYQHYNHPFLYLQPAKEEVIFDDPRLVFYRNILNDKEIAFVKRLASPRLQRATIQNAITGNLEFADYRISKSAWVKQEEDQLIRSIRFRVQAYTGLELDTAEDLQVVNYGIGGHYEPHFDFARVADAYEGGIGNRIATMLFYAEETNAFQSLGTGNRIATALFYMSDVEAGGATVFTKVGARVLPTKGTAVFWYNLRKSGQGNYDTRHAACPVLSGSKWVANIWIHELGQEFKRKCGLSASE
ncbi:prolyl 4-hydroxylase subunit alpha-1 isoform X1 [Strongylocentrotus purpuratus]|uniref:procollagen-proline 4-dioxygenase n=2 Tax=Strongylocentrotus purpuratus TaxID=7668 RepID=A0A7M7NFS2_STRPU|nr:prolyl 4-hydroxylase subunit alpha-1 isoform X1 [Strongylocentrotus purpuratus]